jgi:hypothetical protein
VLAFHSQHRRLPFSTAILIIIIHRPDVNRALRAGGSLVSGRDFHKRGPD